MARRRAKKGGDDAMGLFLVVAAGVLFAAVTAGFYLYPIACTAAFWLSSKAAKTPPELPDPEDFDSVLATVGVAQIVNDRTEIVQKRSELYGLADRYGLSRTKASGETRFDTRKRHAKEINAALDSADRNISAADDEIYRIRGHEYGGMPAWSKPFEEWSRLRALNLAVRYSLQSIVIFYIVFGVLHTFIPGTVGWLFSLSGSLAGLLIWKPFPPSVMTTAFLLTCVGYISGVFFYYRQKDQLLKLADGARVQAWRRLERKWDPNVRDYEPFRGFDWLDDGDTKEEEDVRVVSGNDGSHWWDILGVPASATIEDVKSAYREAIKKYHSDKVAGLGQKLQVLAEEESKRINVAYAEAKAQLGFK